GFVLGKFFVHFIIKGLVDTVFNLFELGYLAATCRPEWTLSAILFTAAIALLLIAFTVGYNSLEGQISVVSAFFYTFVTVLFFVENKTFSLRFVLSEIGYPSI